MDTQPQKKQETNTFEAFVTKAYGLIEQEKHKEAYHILQQLLEKSPNQPNCLFGIAIIHYKQQQYHQAKRILYRLIEKFPNSTPAMDVIASILSEENQFEEAKFYLDKVLQAEPTNPVYQRNLANWYQRQQQWKRAEEFYKNAIALKPDYAECYVNLGYLAEKEHNFNNAKQFFQKTLSITSDNVEALIGLASCHLEQHQFTEARNFFDKALSTQQLLEQPESTEEYAQALLMLGKQLIENKRYLAALFCFETVAKLTPKHEQGYMALGELYLQQHQYALAMRCFEKAYEVNPRCMIALFQMGEAHLQRRETQPAKKYFQKVLAANPYDVTALTELAVTYDREGDWQKAQKYYHQIIKHYEQTDLSLNSINRVNYATARYRLGLIQLRNRNYQEGWANYQFRKNIGASTYLENLPKITNLEESAGKKILLLNDQEHSDMLQFIRFSSLLKQHGCYTHALTKHDLRSVLQSCPYLDESSTFLSEEDLAGYHQLLVTDIPFLKKIQEKDFMGDHTYLSCTEEKSHEVDTFLVSTKRLKVGICFQDNWSADKSKNHSVALRHFSLLFKLPDIDFFSLVVNTYENNLQEHADQLYDLHTHLNDFSDLAGVISQLDLVISVDSAVAHLAGAMQKPCWILLSYASDWRWQIDREDSPWYASVRLFRQTTPGEWEDVMKSVVKTLAHW